MLHIKGSERFTKHFSEGGGSCRLAFVYESGRVGV